MAKDAAVPKTAPPPKKAEPLWSIPIPIIGGTGPIGSGKTLFGWGINPDDATTAVNDFELSGVSYASQRPLIRYTNVAAEMAALHPEGTPPGGLWAWWSDWIIGHVNEKKTRVLVIDPASELEDSMADHIRHFPGLYGLHPNQIQHSPALLWGVLKQKWKEILSSLAGRVECLYFTVHMKREFVGNKPGPKFIPKGKTVLPELATMFLEFRRPIIGGNQRDVPQAKVLKGRMSTFKMVKGEHTPVRCLPPYLDWAVPGQIRYYLANPFGDAEADASQMVPEEPLSEADRLEAELTIQESRQRTAELQVEVLSRQEKIAAAQASIRAAKAPPMAPVPSDPPSNGDLPAPTPTSDPTVLAYRTMMTAVEEAIKRNILTKATWQASIEKRGKKKANDLTEEQMREVHRALVKKMPDFVPF